MTATIIAVACSAGVVATYTLSPIQNPRQQTVLDGSLDENIDAISSLLQCDQRYRLYDDLYNYALTKGVTCVAETHNVTVARVYESARDVDIALQDWPLSAVDRFLVRGGNWFAVGSESVVRGLAARIEGSSLPNQDQPGMATLTAEEEGRTSCVRFLTNALSERVLAPDQFEAEREDMQMIYPELIRLLSHELTGGQIEHLRSISHDDLGFESQLSLTVNPLKRICASAPAR